MMKSKILAIILSLFLISVVFSFKTTESHTDKYVVDMDLHYDNGKISVNGYEVRKGMAPDYAIFSEEAYTLSLMRKNKEIYSFKFDVPRKISIDNLDENGLSGEELVREEFDFTIRVPYVKGVEKMEIRDSGNTKVLDKNTRGLDIEIAQKSRVAVSIKELDNVCKTLIKNGDQENKIDVVFVSDNFSRYTEISDLNPENYIIEQDMGYSDIYYVDRGYHIVSIPVHYGYKYLTWIRTANDDKDEIGEDFLNFILNEESRVYVALDTREGLPSWVQEEGWIDNDNYVIIEALNGRVQHNVYYKDFESGYVGIDGNEGKGNMYVVFVESLSSERKQEFRNVVTEHIDVNDEYEGILSIEPFQSNAEKFNFYFIDDYRDLDCDSSTTCKSNVARNLAEQCGGYDEVIVLVNSDNARGWAYLNGHFAVSRAYSRFGPAPGVTVHEFGHSFGGLSDEYVNTAHESKTWLPNCEPANTTDACSDWCSGEPVEPETIFNECNYILDMDTCEDDWGCMWLDVPDPYFGTSCVGKYYLESVGTECQEGTGCYWQCDGYSGWRPTFDSCIMFTIQENDNVFDPVCQNHLNSLLDNYY